MFLRGTIAATLACLLLLAAEGATLPRQAPDFTIEMINGPALKLSQFRGKAVVLTFILTTCSHCQRTTGHLVKLQNEFAPRGVQVLECAIEQMAKANVGNFSRTYLTPFPVGYSNNNMAVLDFLQHPAMQVPHMPLMAFIDPDGMIREQREGNDEVYFGANQEQNLRASIEALLKPAAAPKKSAPARSKRKKTP